MVHGPVDGPHGLAEDSPSVVFFVFFFPPFFDLVLFLYFLIFTYY
jgi:hypothetical protein